MKKLLVILMLGAGLVTVASADNSLDCTNNTTNLCCIDVASIQSAISQSTTHTVATSDYYNLYGVLTSVNNDGTDGNNCKDIAGYYNNGRKYGAEFQWLPGDWAYTIVWYSNGSSANKDNAIIHANNPDARIITNN